MALPKALINKAKTEFDLTETSDQTSLHELTHALLDAPGLSLDELQEAARDKEAPLEFRIAAKLVESKLYLKTVTTPTHLGVVFAMWGEHNRLYPKSESNPNGEDSLRTKIRQLKWATEGTPIKWTLYCVDDGCPHGSGRMAEEIIAEEQAENSVKVLYLAKAVPTSEGPLTNLASADDSRKGGAIILGCMQALKDGANSIMYTDADNSVHLGQIGLLLKPYLENNIKVVLGNRKHQDAVLVKVEGRWGIGIKVLRHMQRMIGQAIFSRDILDTQAAFKLYDSSVLEKIIAKPSVYDFSFDSDWILGAISMDEPFEKVPFAFIDSAAESASIAQGPMTTWELLLKGLVAAVRQHNIPHNEEMAKVLDDEIQSSKDLDLLINHLPAELENAPDNKLGDPEIMSPAAMKAWIQERKKKV